MVHSFKRIFTLNEKGKEQAISDNKVADEQQVSVQQHIHCIMCYVAHLPSPQQLSGVISSVLPNYPQLTNIPIVGDTITQSSFETDYSIYNNVDDHIHEYRLTKKQIEELDEIMTNKIKMDLTQPWWDIFLITPDVANDIRALDPQHAMLCVVVFRFHQSIIDQPTIKQFLYDISAEFNKLNGYFEDVEDVEEEEQKSGQHLFGLNRFPSQFNLPSHHGSETDEATDEMINEMNEANPGNTSITQIQQNIVWCQHQFEIAKQMVSAAFIVFKMWFKNGNVFDSNNGFSAIQVITERFEDTALTKIQREAEASLQHIGRACIAGAIYRYFQDNTTKQEKTISHLLESSRILEAYDLSQNQTELISVLNEKTDEYSTQIPLFRESIGLTSIELCIGDDYNTSRSRLMSIAHPHDIAVYYRIAFWMNKFFKFLCLSLPDLVSKKLISTLIQNHTMELCYFAYTDNFILGSEPVEDLRVFKTNLNIPCLCISSYNEHISLDLTFNSIAIQNPAGLIQGFLAELEQLEAMFR
eukprot:CAMPEP_0197059318 /NCGR_PEP_ID=MMETSP1384-20130603/116495_1 /TAXON_ID=29189 /ORGANISM="Ammonia sp." /LENGTH=526 /DNA_ID=CAMNT_0042494359 /DNA_START=192 /DNA_END=1772 /DNA_ORIENTATION=-